MSMQNINCLVTRMNIYFGVCVYVYIYIIIIFFYILLYIFVFIIYIYILFYFFEGGTMYFITFLIDKFCPVANQ